MRIYLTRHGETELNRRKLMQGLTDEPLNDTGICQAVELHQRLQGVTFDRVYASTLDRAVTTAAIIAGIEKDAVIQDARLLETDFGPYELLRYDRIGPCMGLYWALPEVFPAPKGVESIRSMVERSSSFLSEIEAEGMKAGYENVLITCHGGIIRVLRGYLEDRKKGYRWRPKPENCEVTVYDFDGNTHRSVPLI